MKEIIKKIVPKWAIELYHWVLAETGAFVYGYPSRKMVVIGVTGTKGKSTTSYLIAKLLEDCGYKTGLSSTILFKIGEREWLNDKKMTMVGRFGLQKLLKQMARAHCQYAIVETSSEGISQYRHKGIDYDIAVFTNLSPEHIESHGSYGKYRAAKAKLFKGLGASKSKGVRKATIINLDDKEADYFLRLNENNLGYTLRGAYGSAKETVSADHVETSKGGSIFEIDGTEFKTKLLGEFNISNAVAAIAVLKNLGIPLEKVKRALEKIDGVPGRLEFINEGQDFSVIVDYAHELASFNALYSVVQQLKPKKIIQVFGATGGGRDKAKRAKMGEIADKNADIIILTNDDPYMEDQRKIAEDVRQGIKKKQEGKNLFIILDRKEAIRKGIGLAEKGDMVLITGKGSEQVMAIGGKKIPWDDREIARRAMSGLKLKTKN